MDVAWSCRPLKGCLSALALLGLGVSSGCDRDHQSLRGIDPPAGAMWLDSLDLREVTQDFGPPIAGRSVDNHPLTLNGAVYPHGFGTRAPSSFAVDLHGSATQFVCMVGVDDEEKGAGAAEFQVFVDGKRAWDSGVILGGSNGRFLSVNLTGARRMILKVLAPKGGSGSARGDWAGGAIMLAAGTAGQPSAATVNSGPPALRIAPVPREPSIHGPRIVGSTPGHPFLFLIPATGQPPLFYSARNLPRGLRLDARSGIISGSLERPGTFIVNLSVKGRFGTARRNLSIVGGPHKLALTPPMGWNSWNVWADAVNADRVQAAADAMITSGLAAHGYQYINIDDAWEGKRDAAGNITPNNKFPDIKALAESIHNRGLKLGIYSSPGPTTCAGYPASYRHEQQDAGAYARWGIDYLKYDWCSYGGMVTGSSLQALQKPYRVMQQALDWTHRDIVYSLCQYGMGNVWTWGAEVGGNCWRTTRDINDSWSSLQSIGFSQDAYARFASPGHWNDPDMLVVGNVGWGNPHPSRLKPNEQILHISLWSLLAAPLLIGCDISKLDGFTLALLTNDEVLEIDQDALGKPAVRVARAGDLEVWSRPLRDGATAVGLFNRGIEAASVKAQWQDLGLEGSQPVRDLWQHQDMGSFTGSFSSRVPAHGVTLLKIGKPQKLD